MNYYDAILKLDFQYFFFIPINLFGNSSSNNNVIKIDISVFVQKPYLRTTSLESNMEEDFDLKNQYRIKKVT